MYRIESLVLYVPVTAVGAIIGEHIDQLVSEICRNHSHTSGDGTNGYNTGTESRVLP